jgi:hypothetical protein
VLLLLLHVRNMSAVLFCRHLSCFIQFYSVLSCSHLFCSPLFYSILTSAVVVVIGLDRGCVWSSAGEVPGPVLCVGSCGPGGVVSIDNGVSCREEGRE